MIKYNKLKKIYVIGDSLLGDWLMITPALKAIKAQSPDVKIIVGMPPESFTRGLVSMCKEVDDIYTMPQAAGMYEKNKDLWAHPYSEFYTDKTMSMVDSHASAAHTVALKHNVGYAEAFCKIYEVPFESAAYSKLKFNKVSLPAYLENKKMVICARHSRSCTSNDPKYNTPNKCFDNSIWIEIANELIKKGYTPVAVGAKSDLEDPKYLDWPGEKVYGADMDMLCSLMDAAYATISVDTGIRHMAAALGCNLITVACAGNLPWIYCEPNTPGQIIKEIGPTIPEVTSTLVLDQFLELEKELGK